MATRAVVAPVSRALKSFLDKSPVTEHVDSIVELKKRAGPNMAASLDALEASLHELDGVTTIKGVDFSKPIDQFLQWDLIEKELEPHLPGLAGKIRQMQLAPDALPFEPNFDALRGPFEDKVAEMMEEAVAIEDTCKEIAAGLKDRIAAVEADLESIKHVLVEDILVKYPEINKQIEKELYLHDFKSLVE